LLRQHRVSLSIRVSFHEASDVPEPVLTGVGPKALKIQVLLDLVQENQRTVPTINQAS
jgi:hypothetical protein